MLERWPIEIDTSIEIPFGVEHDILLFTAVSIFSMYWKTRNHDTLKEKFMEIDQQLCKPVGQGVEAIWNDAMEHVKGNESAATIGCDKIAIDVQKELDRHKHGIESYDGPKIAMAHQDLNQVLQAAQQKRPILNKDGTKGEVAYLQLKDVYINAIPIEITVYEDPINASMPEQMYKMKFQTHAGNKILTTPKAMTLDDIMIFLNGKSLISQPVGAKGALSIIIQAFERADEIKVSKEIEAPGFFLVDGKIVASHMNIKSHSIEEIKETALFLNELVNKFHRLDVISTGIHWGEMAPFDYVLKQYTDEMIWIQWLGLSGSTQVGKSYHWTGSMRNMGEL